MKINTTFSTYRSETNCSPQSKKADMQLLSDKIILNPYGKTSIHGTPSAPKSPLNRGVP